MTHPLVSVIVPNYNYAQFLPARLDSILNQTYTNMEVILLDDCSTDDSVDILNRYAKLDKRIRVVEVNTSNSGSPFRQWEKGIRMAQGKYIWIAEADDCADLQLLEQAVEVLESNPEIVIAKTDSYLVNTEDGILERDLDRWRKRRIQEGQIDIWDGTIFVRQEQYWVNRIYNASGVVFRADAIDAHTWTALDIPNVADWLFWAEIALKGKVAEIHLRLNHFRQHDKSLTHSDEALAKAAMVDIQVMHRIQQLLPIPIYARLWRARKTIKHYHLLARRQYAEIATIIRLAIKVD